MPAGVFQDVLMGDLSAASTRSPLCEQILTILGKRHLSRACDAADGKAL